jgi:thiosulfate dehydrogenase [quinone] large subunit
MTTESTECCKSKESTECCKSDGAADCCNACPQTNLGLIYGAWLLRAWLAVRAIQTGVEKLSGMVGSDQPITLDGKANGYGLTEVSNIKEYALSHYHGVPEALMTKFKGEPLMLKWALPLYDKVLGPALIVLGLTILLGVASRTSYFLLGLLYISLTWGLILIKEDAGVAWLGVHMIMIVMALWLSKYNRLCVLKKW